MPPNKAGPGPGAFPDSTYGDEPNDVGAVDPMGGYGEDQSSSAGGADEQGTDLGSEYNASPSPSDTGIGGFDQDPDSPAAGSGADEQGTEFGSSGYGASPSPNNNGMGDFSRHAVTANPESSQSSTGASGSTGDYEQNQSDLKDELSDQPIDPGSSEYGIPTLQGDNGSSGYGSSTLPGDNGSSGPSQGADPAGLELPPHPGSQPMGDPNQAFPGGEGEEATSPGAGSASSGNDPYSSGAAGSTGDYDQTPYDPADGINRQHTDVASSEYGTSGMPGDNGSPSGSTDDEDQAQSGPTDELSGQSTDHDPSEYEAPTWPGETGSEGVPQGADPDSSAQRSGSQPIVDETPALPENDGSGGPYPDGDSTSSVQSPGSQPLGDETSALPEDGRSGGPYPDGDPTSSVQSPGSQGIGNAELPTSGKPSISITPPQSGLQGPSPLSLAPVPSAATSSDPSAAGSFYPDETEDAGARRSATPNPESD